MVIPFSFTFKSPSPQKIPDCLISFKVIQILSSTISAKLGSCIQFFRALSKSYVRIFLILSAYYTFSKIPFSQRVQITLVYASNDQLLPIFIATIVRETYSFIKIIQSISQNKSLVKMESNR